MVTLANAEHHRKYELVNYLGKLVYINTEIKKRFLDKEIELQENRYSYKANIFIKDKTDNQGILFLDITQSKEGRWIDFSLYSIAAKNVLLKNICMRLDSMRRHHILLKVDHQKVEDSFFELTTTKVT